MAINKKIITMLVLVMAVGTITATYALSTSFIGEDCEVFNQEFNQKACNDINNLNDRLTVVEDTPEHGTSTRIIDVITVGAHGTYGHVASCPVGTYITNVGYTRTDQVLPPVSEPPLDVTSSYLQNDTDWYFSFANPTDESIGVWVVYSCL